MRFWLCTILLFFSFSLSFAQGHQDSRVFETDTPGPSAIHLDNQTPFITATLIFESEQAWFEEQIQIRFSEDGLQWGHWQPFLPQAHFEAQRVNSSGHFRHVSDLIFAEANAKYYQLNTDPKDYFHTFKLHFFAPLYQASTIKTPKVVSRSVCPLPAFEGRGDWCSTANCPFGNSPSITDVTHLIVHHSAGTSVSNDWPAIVRAIWDLHVNSNGWDDIGYNWLIDANGILYQGRQDNVQGAHFSGHNGGTMGICVLGNFMQYQPTQPSLRTLEKLLCWKSEQKDINPLTTSYHASSGLTIYNISGHRDGGATLCPGDNLYDLLPNVRDTVDSLLNITSLVVPDTESKQISIHPTFTSGDIQIQWVQRPFNSVQAQLIAPSGNIMLQQDIQSGSIISLANYPKGLYYISVTGDTFQEIHKIVLH